MSHKVMRSNETPHMIQGNDKSRWNCITHLAPPDWQYVFGKVTLGGTV